MILRRMGNKSKIAADIQAHFPAHTVYCEPFFGAGGMFFNKAPAKYNYLNDIDNDVHNLFIQVMNNKQALYDYIDCVPYHKGTFQYFKELQPANDLERAVKFCVLSNWGYMGKPETLKYGNDNSKIILLENINRTFEFVCKSKAQFNNVDFRKFFAQWHYRHERGNHEIFYYCDPPYLGTDNNYSHSFVKKDAVDLFDCCINSGCKFAISEFDNPFILDIAKSNKLNIITIGERVNMKNRRTEILITNYTNHPTLFN